MRVVALLVLGIAVVGGSAAAAQRARVSPHETIRATVGAARITVTDGRPSMRGRRIMGGLVPDGRVWATGTDEATTLTTVAVG